jgi:hypothetical protein
VVGILEDLQKRKPEADESAQKILDGQPLIFDEEILVASVCLSVIQKCVKSDDQMIEVSVGRKYTHESKFDYHLDTFRQLFLEPIYEYIDEQLDDQRTVLGLLLKYKRKCEWFQRRMLYDIWNTETRSGEKSLAWHLYEFLFDQGLDILIEPSSASGEVDLISMQHHDDALIADAKIFNPEKSKGLDYIAKGFNQIYLYTLDYNKPSGYLVIFNTSEKNLKFALNSESSFFQYIQHNNKTIFLMVIDIYPHETTASKRGKLQCIEICEDDLVKTIITSKVDGTGVDSVDSAVVSP